MSKIIAQFLLPQPLGRASLPKFGGLKIGSTSTIGFQLYNTADETTNYERLESLWSANVAIVRTASSGTGTNRKLQFAAGAGNSLALSPTGTIEGGFLHAGASTSVAGARGAVFTGWTSTATSGTNVGLSLTPTYNQASGTAANTDLLINRTETAVGSGNQYLIQAQVGGSDRFVMTSAGVGMTASAFRVGGIMIPVANLEVNRNRSAVAWGTTGAHVSVAGNTITDISTAASGTAASAVFTSFAQPTLAATNASVTTTDAATVYIANAPAAGTNQTISNAYALWIDAGRIRYDETASASVGTASTHKVPINIGGTLYYILLTNV